MSIGEARPTGAGPDYQPPKGVQKKHEHFISFKINRNSGFCDQNLCTSYKIALSKIIKLNRKAVLRLCNITHIRQV